ncbi:NDUBB dehydrogenase, partial [Setophaga kirtlandii]|nr:NDUBB dehydrogenase [Setophaga kirtlandii]
VPKVWGSPVHPLARRLQQWARREAEILVRERERCGQPLLTSNYYDPKRLP